MNTLQTASAVIEDMYHWIGCPDITFEEVVEDVISICAMSGMAITAADAPVSRCARVPEISEASIAVFNHAVSALAYVCIDGPQTNQELQRLKTGQLCAYHASPTALFLIHRFGHRWKVYRAQLHSTLANPAQAKMCLQALVLLVTEVEIWAGQLPPENSSGTPCLQ